MTRADIVGRANYGPRRCRFTPDLWAKWWAARDPDDPHCAQLAAGIAEFRARVAEVEARIPGRLP